MNQQPSSESRLLVAGYGAIGRAMVKQAPQCQWVSLNRAPCSNVSHHIQADLLNLTAPFPDDCPDIIIYTATPDSRTPEAYEKTYVEGLRNLLSWIHHKPVKHLFYVSSTSVYGHHQGERVDESSPLHSTSFTGQCIAQGEQLLESSSIPYTLVRFGGIYGNGREMLIRLVQQGVELAADPAPLTNRIHETDCAGVLLHLMALALQEQPLSTAYIAVDDDGADKATVYTYIEKSLGLSDKVKRLPSSADNLGKRCLNSRLKETGYQFIYPSYREGYGELIQEKYCD